MDCNLSWYALVLGIEHYWWHAMRRQTEPRLDLSLITRHVMRRRTKPRLDWRPKPEPFVMSDQALRKICEGVVTIRPKMFAEIRDDLSVVGCAYRVLLEWQHGETEAQVYAMMIALHDSLGPVLDLLCRISLRSELVLRSALNMTDEQFQQLVSQFHQIYKVAESEIMEPLLVKPGMMKVFKPGPIGDRASLLTASLLVAAWRKCRPDTAALKALLRRSMDALMPGTTGVGEKEGRRQRQKSINRTLNRTDYRSPMAKEAAQTLLAYAHVIAAQNCPDVAGINLKIETSLKLLDIPAKDLSLIGPFLA